MNRWHPRSLPCLLVYECQCKWVNADVSWKQWLEMINSEKKVLGIITQQILFLQVLQWKKTGKSALLLHNMAAVLTVNPNLVVMTGCVFNKRVQKSSLPCFEVCNAKAVCGIQSNTAIPNNAAQQWSQLRWNPVQHNLRGHVVHFNQFKICIDTFTTQYTALMMGSLCAVLFNNLLLFMPQIILIKQNLTNKKKKKWAGK